MADNSEALSACQAELVQCRTENERLKSDHEQAEEVFGQLQQQFNDLSASQGLVAAERDRLANLNADLQSKIADLQSSLAAASTKADDASVAKQKAEMALRVAKEDAESQKASADLKQRELDRMAEELRVRSDRLEQATQRESSITTELSNAKASERVLRMQVDRISQEKDIESKAKAFAEGEAARLRDELLRTRTTASARDVDLAASLEQSKQEGAAKDRRIAELSRELEGLRAQVAELKSSSTESESANGRKIDALQREKVSLEKLCSLYKDNATAASERVSQLETALEQLRSEAEAALQRASAEAQKALAASNDQRIREVSSLQDSVESLRKELEDTKRAAAEAAAAVGTPAQRVLQALQADQSAGGAATSTALELLRRASHNGGAGAGAGAASSSSGDLSATALYARVEVAESALSAEKAESAGLRAYLGQILSEIEAKAPLIQQQRVDYERALIAHEELSKRLATSMRDTSRLSSELGAEKAARQKVEARTSSLAGEILDLRKQIIALLRSAKQQQGMLPLTPAGAAAGNMFGTASGAFGFGQASFIRSARYPAAGAGQAAAAGGDGQLSLMDLTSSAPAGGEAPSTTPHSAALGAFPTSDSELIRMAAGDFSATAASSTVGVAAGSSKDANVLASAEAQSIIEEHLLTYRDVEELQSRNQQLIRVVRQLARQLAKSGSIESLFSAGNAGAGASASSSALALSSSSSNTSLSASSLGLPSGTSAADALRSLMAELQDLRSSRERQAAMVATVVQQRDMYRLLLSQSDAALLAQGDAQVRAGMTSGAGASAGAFGSPAGGGAAEPRSSPHQVSLAMSRSASSASSRGGAGAGAAALDASVAQIAQATSSNLQAMLDDTRSQLEQMRNEAREAVKAAEARVSAMRDEVIDLKQKLAATQSESKFNAERVTQVQQIADGARAEASREVARVGQLQVRVGCAFAGCLCVPLL